MTTHTFEKIKSGDKWAWRYGDWESEAFPYLEDRPWSPILVAGIPCFTVSNNPHLSNEFDYIPFEDQKWCVVWGEERGKWFQDITNLADHEHLPIYIAVREKYPECTYHIVHGSRISQPFEDQISYELFDDRLVGRKFSSRYGMNGPPIELVWRALNEIS